VPSREAATPAIRQDHIGVSTTAAAAPSHDVSPSSIREGSEPLGTWLLIGIDTGCLIVTTTLATVILLGADGAFRLLLALAFTSVVPGWALVRALGLATISNGAVLTIPLSLAICAGSSAVMVWLNEGQPLVLLAALATVSVAVIGWMLRIQVRSLSNTAAGLAGR
jgi:hypothetical protein